MIDLQWIVYNGSLHNNAVCNNKIILNVIFNCKFTCICTLCIPVLFITNMAMVIYVIPTVDSLEIFSCYIFPLVDEIIILHCTVKLETKEYCFCRISSVIINDINFCPVVSLLVHNKKHQRKLSGKVLFYLVYVLGNVFYVNRQVALWMRSDFDLHVAAGCNI